MWRSVRRWSCETGKKDEPTERSQEKGTKNELLRNFDQSMLRNQGCCLRVEIEGRSSGSTRSLVKD